MNKIEEKAKSIPVYWNGHCSALEWPMNSCPFLWMFCQPFSEIYSVTRLAFYKRDEDALLERLAVEQTKATATVPEQTIAFVFNSLRHRAPMN